MKNHRWKVVTGHGVPNVKIGRSVVIVDTLETDIESTAHIICEYLTKIFPIKEPAYAGSKIIRADVWSSCTGDVIFLRDRTDDVEVHKITNIQSDRVEIDSELVKNWGDDTCMHCIGL